MRGSKWAAVATAIESWGKTARFCVILLVRTVCLVAPVLICTWLLAGHGVSAAEVARVVAAWFSR